MDTALLEEKEEFVKLFIEHSVVDLKDYLTETKLQYLYDKVGYLSLILQSCIRIGHITTEFNQVTLGCYCYYHYENY